MKNYALSILILLLSFSFSYSYWPVQGTKTKELTSTFAEYRPGHFHSGIDIKTDGKEGFPVITDIAGYIYKIGVSTGGYGKVIYLKAQDSSFRVYAHLSKFNKDIESFIRKEQYKKKSYSLVIYPPKNKFKIKKMGIIGKSGSTGIGYPHLHFEVRTAFNIPLDPLNRIVKLKDTLAPIISNIAIIPFGDASTINDKNNHLILNKNFNQKDSVIRVQGAFSLAINNYDANISKTNKLAPFSYMVEMDDSIIYSFRCDSFSFANSRQVGQLFNIKLKSQIKKNFFNLFVPYRCRIKSFSKPEFGSGIIRKFNNKISTIKISSTDLNSNTSVFRFKVKFKQFNFKKKPNTTSTNIQLDNYSYLDLKPQISLISKENSLQIKIKNKNIRKNPVIYVSTDKNEVCPLTNFNKDDSSYIAYIKHPNYSSILNFTIIIHNLKHRFVYHKSYLLSLIKENEAKFVFSKDSIFFAEVKPNSLFNKKVFWIEPYTTKKEINFKQLKLLSKIKELKPKFVYFDKKIKVGIRHKNNPNTGIFYIKGNGKIALLSKFYNKKRSAYSGSFDYTAPFFLAQDTIPPTIKLIKRKKSYYTKKSKIYFKLFDIGSGISSNKNIETSIDSNWHLSLYDPETNLLSISLQKISKGKHNIQLKVKDNLENSSDTSFSFFIKH